MGEESRRVSRAFGLGWFSIERHGAAGCRAIHPGRLFNDQEGGCNRGPKTLTVNSMDQVIKRILACRAAVPASRSLLLGLSGIDGSGKGYVAGQVEAHLAQYGVAAAIINA